MKKIALAFIGSALIYAPTLAEQSTREYYLGPVEAGAITFRAQAVKYTDAQGSKWLIKLLATTPMKGVSEFFTLDEAHGLIKAFKSLESAHLDAEASQADIYEKQVTATSTLDVLYRYERARKKHSFRLTTPGLKTESEQGTELNKMDITALIKTISVALEKASSQN